MIKRVVVAILALTIAPTFVRGEDISLKIHKPSLFHAKGNKNSLPWWMIREQKRFSPVILDWPDYRKTLLGEMKTSAIISGEGDVSVYVQITKGEKKAQIMPWAMYCTGKVCLDTRENYDIPNTLSLFLGKPFRSGPITIIPEVGVILSTGSYYRAPAAEVLVYGGGKWWELSSQSEVALNGIGRRDRERREYFAYNWTEILVKVDRHFFLGVGEQVEWTFYPSQKPLVDVGPAIKIPLFWRVYAKSWWTKSTSSKTEKIISVIGVGF